MKEVTKVQINDQICKQVELMRRGGANQTEIGKLMGISAPTICRIEKAGFNYEQYLENKRISREKEQKAKEQAEEPQAQEEQVPGQIEMELIEARPLETNDKVKMMRFQAGQVDKLVLKLDHINDTLNMILRVMRKE